MIIIGLDLSFTGTGLVKFKDGGVLDTKLIKTIPEGKDICSRFHRINECLTEVNDFCFTEFDEEKIIVIEGYSFNSRSGMCFSIGEMGGVIKNHLYQMYLLKSDKVTKFLEIPPTQLKKFITGKGQCKKELILKEIYKNFGFDTDDNNIADAYALAYLGYSVYCVENKISIKLNKVQKEMIDKITKEK